MLIKKSGDLPYSEITPKSFFIHRRKFLTTAAAAAGLATLSSRPIAQWLQVDSVLAIGTKLDNIAKSTYSSTETPTPRGLVTSYNNFVEFGDRKSDPSKNAGKFQTSPWSVSVEGEVGKPRTFTTDELMKLAPFEERIYRHRCVEGWSIVVPWIGYSFNTLVKLAQPTSKARYVAFQSYYDPRQMPWARGTGLDFPSLLSG